MVPTNRHTENKPLYPSTCSMNKNEQLTLSKCPQEPCCFLLPHSHTISQFLYKEGKRQLPSDNSILYCHHQQCNEFRLKIESYWIFHEGIQFTFDQKKVSDFERYCKSTYIQVLQSTHMHLKQKLLSKAIRKFRSRQFQGPIIYFFDGRSLSRHKQSFFIKQIP